MKSYCVKYYPIGDSWSIYPIVRRDMWVFNKVEKPTEAEPYYLIIIDSDCVASAVASAEQAFTSCQDDNAADKFWRKDLGQI